MPWQQSGPLALRRSLILYSDKLLEVKQLDAVEDELD